MNERPQTVLLLGYGNPGRLDDGLGPALAAQLAPLGLPGVTVDSDYQLCVEDAEVVARHDIVIFADAATAGPEPFAFARIEPTNSLSFSSHSLQPEAVLGMAQQLFSAQTEGYTLSIRGYEFNEYKESLSEKGRANLSAAVAFIKRACRQRNFLQLSSEKLFPGMRNLQQKHLHLRPR